MESYSMPSIPWTFGKFTKLRYSFMSLGYIGVSATSKLLINMLALPLASDIKPRVFTVYHSKQILVFDNYPI